MNEKFFFAIAIIQFAFLLIDCLSTLFSNHNKKNTKQLHRYTQLCLSCSFVIIAFIFWIQSFQTADSFLRFWIFAGITLSLLGQLLVASIFKVTNRLFYVMVMYVLAHFSIMMAFREISYDFHYYINDHLFIPIGGIFFSILLWRILVYSKNQSFTFHCISFIYGALIAHLIIMSITISTISDGFYLITGLASFIYVLSVLCIIYAEMKKIAFPNLGVVVWGIYSFSQLVLIYTVAI